MKHRFKRGQIIKSRVDYLHRIVQGRTYVVSWLKKDEHGHCYVVILDDVDYGITLTQDFFAAK